MKLFDLITESKSFDTFAEKRLGGASKIAEGAKEKGGPAMLTYHHFKVKLPYYEKAAECKFDLKDYLKEGKNKIGIVFNMDPHYKSGSHWISLFINVKKKVIFFFDSVGLM